MTARCRIKRFGICFCLPAATSDDVVDAPGVNCRRATSPIGLNPTTLGVFCHPSTPSPSDRWQAPPHGDGQ
jgi:hypothetical protein